MIWGPISRDTLERAMERAAGAANLPRSIRHQQHGDGSSLAGALGELCVEAFLERSEIPYRYVGHEMFNHDLEVGWATIDVKAKCRTAEGQPSLDWEASVELFQLARWAPTYYWFVSLHHHGGRDGSKDPEAFHHAAILGACPKWQMVHQGRELKQGVADRDGYTPHVDQVNLDYRDLLYPPSAFISRLRWISTWDHLSDTDRREQESRRARR